MRVAEAIQAFWQFSKFALSSEVPLPLGQAPIHSIVWFWAESLEGTTMQVARQVGSCGLPFWSSSVSEKTSRFSE